MVAVLFLVSGLGPNSLDYFSKEPINWFPRTRYWKAELVPVLVLTLTSEVTLRGDTEIFQDPWPGGKLDAQKATDT